MKLKASALKTLESRLVLSLELDVVLDYLRQAPELRQEVKLKSLVKFVLGENNRSEYSALNRDIELQVGPDWFDRVVFRFLDIYQERFGPNATIDRIAAGLETIGLYATALRLRENYT